MVRQVSMVRQADRVHALQSYAKSQSRFKHDGKCRLTSNEDEQKQKKLSRIFQLLRLSFKVF